MSDRPEFSVCQFFVTGEHEYVRRYVMAQEAVNAFFHYTNNVAVKMGIVEKVIITDGGDCCVYQWEKDKGITFPASDDG